MLTMRKEEEEEEEEEEDLSGVGVELARWECFGGGAGGGIAGWRQRGKGRVEMDRRGGRTSSLAEKVKGRMLG